ncbi:MULTISPECIES: acetyl-CoA acetyltransferase [unclassified Variovorax]|uniref:acetyl-CoA acetyltransferase n=1 Tax=unclassified Variovorax TaxID=663243 RepID=UPI001BD1FFB1|nr:MULTISPECIES: acetyl-CoA acetyltransferase [unclassified Variovorax]
MSGPCIVGWGHTAFGKLAGTSLEDMIVEVARQAMEDAEVAPSEIDEIVLGNFNAGLDEQDFPSSLVLQAHPDLRFKPATRVENACASGSAAVYQGLKSIRAGDARIVLVVGAEKMTHLPGTTVRDILVRASYRKDEHYTAEGGFAEAWADIQNEYVRLHGPQDDALARIAAKNHYNATFNPWAHIRKDLGFEFCRHVSERNPIVAGPIKRSDSSLVSDGAAAIILASEDVARSKHKAVAFRAAAHVSDFMPTARRDMPAFECTATAWSRAFERAGAIVHDLDFAEVHDCFTIAELLQYEAMGLTPKGKGATAIDEGWVLRDGRLPINVSGGLKAKGHPIGATGVSMHALAAMQLTGTAGSLQVPGAGLGAISNLGGSACVTYVSILERLV